MLAGAPQGGFSWLRQFTFRGTACGGGVVKQQPQKCSVVILKSEALKNRITTD